jgi:hypothetical protein
MENTIARNESSFGQIACPPTESAIDRSYKIGVPSSIYTLLEVAVRNDKLGSEEPERSVKLRDWLHYNSHFDSVLRSIRVENKESLIKARDADIIDASDFIEFALLEKSEMEMPITLTFKEAFKVLRALRGYNADGFPAFMGCGSEGSGVIAMTVLKAVIEKVMKGFEDEAIRAFLEK